MEEVRQETIEGDANLLCHGYALLRVALSTAKSSPCRMQYGRLLKRARRNKWRNCFST
jgi:hypothetical protein